MCMIVGQWGLYHRGSEWLLCVRLCVSMEYYIILWYTISEEQIPLAKEVGIMVIKLKQKSLCLFRV